MFDIEAESIKSVAPIKIRGSGLPAYPQNPSDSTEEVEETVAWTMENDSAGWYYFIQTSHNLDEGSWFGPFEAKEKADSSYSADLKQREDWFGAIKEKIEPKHYEKSPAPLNQG